jgi:hypothetical protein
MRLERLSERVQKFRSESVLMADIRVWRADAKIVLADYFGEGSIPHQTFAAIRYTPHFFNGRQSRSQSLEAIRAGLIRAESFLKSRISELKDEIDSKETAPSHPIAKHVPLHKV